MIENITQYMNHLPTCNLMQNWKEAEQAVADTIDPQDREEAATALYNARKKCTCGFKQVMNELENHVSPLLLDRELFETFQPDETIKSVVTRIQTVHKPFLVELKFVAVKGDHDDWAIYCHHPNQSDGYIKLSGDKVLGKGLIQSICPCTTEILNRYRF